MEQIEVLSVDLSAVTELRRRFRDDARCQIVRDSILPRGLADPFGFLVDGRLVGHAGIWTEHFPGRILELFLIPEWRHLDADAVRALRGAHGATELEVQTNLLDGERLLRRCAATVWTENLLFEDGAPTDLSVSGAHFRRHRPSDVGPDCEWVVEEDGRIVGGGGILTHYNPPWGDLYMEVIEGERRRGLGGFLVQELRRTATEAGLRAAARCDPENVASRRTLERGGMRLCGALMAGTL